MSKIQYSTKDALECCVYQVQYICKFMPKLLLVLVLVTDLPSVKLKKVSHSLLRL